MKEDKDKLLEERLGHLLSQSVRHEKSGIESCLSEDEMALMLDGNTTSEERDRMMTHIASCDTCLEVFQLSAGLIQEEESGETPGYREFEITTGLLEEKRRTRGFRSYYKSLALAASVLIVAVGMYLFFNSAFIPKTADRHEAFMDEKPAAKESLPQSEPQSSAQTASQDSAPDLEKTDQLSPSRPVPVQEGKSEKMNKSRLEQSRQMKLGLDEKAGKKAAARKDIPDDGLRLSPVPAKKKAITPPMEKQKSTLQKTEETLDNKQLKKPQLKETEQDSLSDQETINVSDSQPAALASAAAANQPKQPVSTTGLQRLNMMTQRQSGYLASIDLRNMFSQALQLKTDLSRSLDRQKNEQRLQYRSRTDSEADVLAEYKPLVQVVQQGGRDMVLPDVAYLLSRSQPGTIEYNFFNLARFGWCTPDGVCVQNQNLVRSFGKDVDKNSLLARWETIYPSLTGTFKQIADATIARIRE